MEYFNNGYRLPARQPVQMPPIRTGAATIQAPPASVPPAPPEVVEEGNPYAVAQVRGSREHPNLIGEVEFHPFVDGTLVVAKISGLPQSQYGKKAGPFLGFHIHEGNSCQEAEGNNPFPQSKEHFNPNDLPHPYHAGDMPMLLSNDGFAYMSVYTNRFTPGEVVGRTVIIHNMTDDFRSQPSGDSGMKIACGVIVSKL